MRFNCDIFCGLYFSLFVFRPTDVPPILRSSYKALKKLVLISDSVLTKIKVIGMG